MLPTKCSAIRGGEQIVINTENVAVGDIVIIKNGSRVPADMRVLVKTIKLFEHLLLFRSRI